MRTEKRKSGIDLIGELPWGSRFCQFYQSAEDLHDILLPYLRAGLENNELCVWVTSPMSGDEDLLQSLKNAVPEFERYAERGQLEIVPSSCWLSAQREQVNAVVSMLDRAVYAGFDGLRIACSALPDKGGDNTIPLHEVGDISRYNVLALLAYPRGEFDASALMEVIKDHRCALVRNGEKWEVFEGSEARIAREELTRSEEKLQFLFSNMSEGFAYHRIVLDAGEKPCDYIFLEVNHAFEILTGLSAGCIIGKRITDIIPGIEKDPADWIGKFGDVALTGNPQQFENYSEALEKWYSVSAFSPHKGFFAVTFSDITSRKKADVENFKLNAELKRRIAELSDANASLRDSRRAALNLMEDAVVARRQAEEASAVLQCEVSERKRAEEALQKAHDELETKVAERTTELREKDQLLLQQSRQAAMGEMIGNIAHQWRQPLHSLSLIIGMLPMLQETGELTPENLASLEGKAMGIIQHMSQTIEDFSNYFKPDKEKVVFQVGDAVAKTLSLIKDSFGSREISIEVEEIENPVIDGFPNEYSQVLLNILLNAKDAFSERMIEDPKVVIRITAEGERAVVAVSDNAGGIGDEIIDKVFDPYFTTKGPKQGTGVGLFMSKGIIEKNMGGRLSVRNTGNGAEFRIEV